MLHAGASGYIPKRAAPDDLVSAVRVVSEGNVFLHSTLAKFLMREMTDEAPQPAAPIAADNLTPREKEVMQLLADGKSAKEVALELGLSRKTVDVHRGHIMTKMRADSPVELSRMVQKLTEPDEGPAS